MSTLFTPLQVGILISVWIITGATFGIIMSFLITRWITISGTFKCYDIFVKITLAIGILGYATIGLCYQFKV